MKRRILCTAAIVITVVAVLSIGIYVLLPDILETLAAQSPCPGISRATTARR